MPGHDMRFVSEGFVRMALVTKHDSNDFPGGVCDGLLVGTGGTANIVFASGLEVSNVPLQAGYNPIQCRRIKTGGTSDAIFAGYFT